MEEGESIRHATRRNIRCISASGHLLRGAEVIRAKTKRIPKFPNLVKDNRLIIICSFYFIYCYLRLSVLISFDVRRMSPETKARVVFN